MTKKAIFFYLYMLWFISPCVYADGPIINDVFSASDAGVEISYDTAFTLPAGRFFSLPTRLICPDVKAGDDIYIIVHNMRKYRDRIGASAPAEDSFMVWTDSENIANYRYDGDLKAFERRFDSGLQRMFRMALFFPVVQDQIPVSRHSSYISRDMVWSGPEYDYGEGPDDYVIGKKNVSFWVHENIFNPFGMIQITATLRAIGRNTDPGGVPQGTNGAYAYIFVNDQEWENGHVDMDVVSQIADAFNGEDGLYTEMTGLLGYESGGGPAGDGGIDGNKNIYILLHDIQDGFDGTGGYVGGYYNPVHDVGATSLYKFAGIHSNEKQMIVLDTYPTITHTKEKNPAGSISVLIHEFQHMIHFNQKTGRDGQLTDTGFIRKNIWLDEACAMLCEDIFKDYTTDPEYFVYNKRIPYYLMNPAWPLDYWPDTSNMDNALKSYATVYSFLAYLARNLSPLILSEIISGAGRDAAGLDAIALASEALGESNHIHTLIKRWREAVVYDDATLPWRGYPYVSDHGYELSELNLVDFLESQGFSETVPAFNNIPEYPAIRKVSSGFNSSIFAGKAVADGDVQINLKNGPHVSHLEYKVIKK